METPTPAKPAITFFHVIWLAASAASAGIVFVTYRDASLLVQLLVTGAAFVVATLVTHVLILFIVTALVIPRLEPGSYWKREVDGYMAFWFPGRW